jgi:hypothetical protein
MKVGGLLVLATIIATGTVHAQVLPEELAEPQFSTCDPKSSETGSWECELLKAFIKIQGIGLGSTRGDLARLFVVSGGISTNGRATYCYRGSHLIQVDVEFATESAQGRSLSDTITRISRPYIAHCIAG